VKGKCTTISEADISVLTQRFSVFAPCLSRSHVFMILRPNGFANQLYHVADVTISEPVHNASFEEDERRFA